MKKDVVLSIRGRQKYADQEPEIIELVTSGTMELRNGGWDITYPPCSVLENGITPYVF
jgi:hypothetical protein